MRSRDGISTRDVVFATAISLILWAACSERSPLAPENVTPRSPQNVVRSNGGCVPEVITTQEGGTETILVTFSADTTVCRIDVSAWGIDMGDTVWGSDGFRGADTPQGNMYWYAKSAEAHDPGYLQNMPSPTHVADGNTFPSQAFIEFDPPVRSVSFYYSTAVDEALWNGQWQLDTDSMPVYAVSRDPGTTTYHIWDAVTLHANVDRWQGPLDTWDSVTLSAPWDAIEVLWFNGSIWIDDLQITRAAQPEITCETVQRGRRTTCRINETVDAVSGWQWVGAVFPAGTDTISATSTSTSWSGTAVQSGLVSAFVTVGGVPDTLAGALQVMDRTGPNWKWDETDWHFAIDSISAVLCSYSPFEFPADSVRLAVNRRASTCDPTKQGSIEPNILADPDSGYTIAQVQDGGPNHGLWYVTNTTYFMDRVAERNPYLERPPNGSPRMLTHPDDLKACRKGKAAKALGLGKNDPVVVNFYQYNSVCRSFSLTGMYEAIWDHEGFGTKGMTAGANGHEARRQYKAAQPGFDPRTEAESKVTTTEAFLRLAVQNSVWDIELNISNSAKDHNHVRDNYVITQGQTTTCGEAWVYHKSPDDRYIKVSVGRTLPSGVRVCI